MYSWKKKDKDEGTDYKLDCKHLIMLGWNEDVLV